MIKRLLNKSPIKTVNAHCDVPCGIYDPYPLQINAHTIIRMTELLEKDADENRKTRYVLVKEQHAEKLKNELRVLWGDYFKENPEIDVLVKKALQQGSKVRQTVDKKTAQELLTTVQEISEIFWKTKKRETFRIKSPYPTTGELVLPK
ncbi:MAG: superoxide dismutase, Ni [Nanoarchaeota archaeon]|nr:superoxide dismutase, Ni [Nanoarchaeota archaeon]